MIAYEIAAILVTSSDLQGHLPTASLQLRFSFSYSCAAVDRITLTERVARSLADS